ncbi:tRNA (adenosine(37)-N6)-threonylcarbamoyltransferase complex transferase subunit TsaD [Candidatus Parcubacteria bacterium]|nr:tRNA (adenosine(37)-N6)-threonylcarbamoyltransferase complex transferase subunit TsaD [Candidatus Parcubacteria bacterium]
MTNILRILSIETSCDETGISIMEYQKDTNTYKVLADSLNSQIEIHKEFGGVFPMMAKREHGNNLTGLLTSCLEKIMSNDQSSVDKENIDFSLIDREKELTEKLKTEFKNPDSLLTKIPHIDYIAVTRGPGLEPALWVGLSFVKFLSKLWNIPMLPINHMEGHISSVLMESGFVEFPTLALLISGGHTELVDVENWGKYSIIGKTRDDAVGEAYDKVARILDLSYPGGPLIAGKGQKLREKFSESDIQLKKDQFSIKLPRPMIHSQDLDLSFSGLKTAVLYMVRDLKKTTETLSVETVDLIAHEFENSVSEVLISKLNFAHKTNQRKYKNLIVAGGVIANEFLKENIQRWCTKNGVHFLKPEKSLATDNAIMIALAAIIGLKNEYAQIIHPKDKEFLEIKPDGDWSLNAIYYCHAPL